ncbi:hypothetical protein AKJ54_00410 [candidate division MSBL1 archaeon SCGC-AAA382K21]|uniref:Peptidase S54 rhomboid domain-containing protein n=1 Tax=candidate division MSBL1 archaeon SCGC-AAA382K21 TaxID=1698283 RepID=A0A133VLI1_9EURY|nr:hypothetical protein AKJ54_00410 [candidate division MSBL1 archaeon SCGC-AAA382K21]
MFDRSGPVVAAIIIALACSTVFYLEVSGRADKMDFGVKKNSIAQEPYRLLTFSFTHDGFSHLFSNIVALLLAGALAREIGISGRTFLLLFLLAGVLALLPALLLTGRTFAGASAGICAIFGALSVDFERYGFSVSWIFSLFLLGMLASLAFGFFLLESATQVLGTLVHFSAFFTGAGIFWGWKIMGLDLRSTESFNPDQADAQFH